MRTNYKILMLFLFCAAFNSCHPVIPVGDKNYRNFKDGYERVDRMTFPCLTKSKMKLTISSDFKKNSEKTIIYPVPNDSHVKISPISKIFHFGEEGIELIHETYTMPSIIKDDLLGNEAYTYEVYIGYYPDGQIKYYKVILFANFIYELRVGTWYHFDEKGRVIKKIAHEDLFKTPLAKVLQIRNDFIKDEVLNKKGYIHFENVLRVIGDGGPVCSIIRYKDLSDNKFKSLIIDDGNNFINRMMEADIPGQIKSYSPYKGYFGYY